MLALFKATGPFDDTPCTWFPAKLDGRRTARVTCSGGHTGLIDEHEISDAGIVTPSVVCTEDGCGWHEWVTLKGWSDG